MEASAAKSIILLCLWSKVHTGSYRDNIPHSHSHVPYRYKVFAASMQCLMVEETITIQVTLGHSLKLWKDPIGLDLTSSHFWGYCCFLQFSLGESIPEKMVTVMKRNGAMECAESARGVEHFLCLIMFHQTFCLGLEPSQFS